jgi:endoglucanase
MDWDLLTRLSETPGVPGREDGIREVVREIMGPLVDSLDTDALGNVIGRKQGAGSRTVMLAAHMDEIGFYVRHVDEKGFLRLQPVGGFDARQLFAQRVQVHTRESGALPGVLSYATKPTHLLSPEERKEAAKIELLFVDLGLSPEAVKERVAIGDMVTLDRACKPCGDSFVGKALDNRVGVFVMVEALRRLARHEVTVCAVATVQEEVGLRGAQIAAFRLEPDVSIALDTTLAGDHPGPTEADAVTRLGQGVGIKILDASLICHPRLVDHLRQIAEARGIPHQMEVLPRGGTDAGAMQRARSGAASITLSVPTRYVHTVNEMVRRTDVEAAVNLLLAYLEEGHLGDYTY